MSDRTEADFAGSAPTDSITNQKWTFKEGAYIELIFEKKDDDEPVAIDLAGKDLRNRLKIRLSWTKQNNRITEFQLSEFKHYKKEGWILNGDGISINKVTLRPFDFDYIIEFLRLITQHNLTNETRRRIKIIDDSGVPFADGDKTKLLEFLGNQTGQELVRELLATDGIEAGDIVNVGYRKRQLKIFEAMLADERAVQSYAQDSSISHFSVEGVWQHFFERNTWIFGYGLAYRFNGVLQSQPSLSDTNASGKGQVIGDFLLSDSKFLTFVEIKRPDTPLFKNRKNRAQTWGLSNELFDSVSQILNQKALGSIKYDAGELYDGEGNQIRAKPVDPPTLLVIGNWSECDVETAEAKSIMSRTLELFRRDSRNIQILTFDELFERAQFIVSEAVDSTTK